MSNFTENKVLYCYSTLSHVPSSLKVVFAGIFGFNAVFASILNLCVLAMFSKVRSLRNKSDLHILSLAVADLVVGTVLSPISVVQVLNKNHENCMVNNVGSFLLTLLAVSAVTLVMISYDRYVHIKHVVLYEELMTRRWVFLMIFVPWFSPSILVGAKAINNEVFTWTILIVYVIAYFLMIFSYIKLTSVLKAREQGMFASNHNLKIMHRQNQKSVRFICLLVATFVSFTSGIFVYRMLMTYDMYVGSEWYRKNKAVFMASGQVIFQINSIVNPLLYFIKHSTMKSTVRQFILRRTARITDRNIELRVQVRPTGSSLA